MKKLIPAYILSFVICFMLFINEPLTMYATNKDDFGFDLYTIIIPLLTVFFVVFLVISLIYTGIYFLNKKFSKKLTVYNIILIISYILFILLYIQGNYLTGDLPPIDGSMMNWPSFIKDNIITISILIILIVTYVITIKKYKYEKVINTSKYISLAVFAMLFVSLITTAISYDLFEKRKVLYISKDNITEASTNKNFYIFLLDAVDSTRFNEILLNSEYKELFNDFTYFKDTLGAYPFTRDSIPFVLSGKWNENETRFREHYNEAMDNSPLIKALQEKDYEINLYETDLRWSTDKVSAVSNIIEYDSSISPICFGKEELRYIAFKYLPYFLKQYSKVDTFDFDYCKRISTDKAFDWNNADYYQLLKNEDLELVDNKYFSFTHIQGGHVPFDTDENLNKVSESNYEQVLRGSLNILNEFINRLKENNVYDNSVIVVLADHGWQETRQEGRQNPILYIKGINEHHNMITSDKPISYEDLMDAYQELLDGKKSTEIFSNISYDRTRRYLWYVFNREDHIVEFELKGKAWNDEDLIPTGREFNR